MQVYKVNVFINEGTEDHCNATLYDFSDNFITELKEVVKPYDVKDYTTQWKQGLYIFYRNMAYDWLIENGYIADRNYIITI